MGRIPKASMAEPKSPLPEGGKVSLDKAETPLESSNPAMEKSETELELQVTPSVGTELATEEKSSRSSSKRKRRDLFVALRRSPRISKSVNPSEEIDTKHVTKKINISASDKEDELVVLEEDNQSEQSLGKTNLQEKVDNLYQLLQAQQETVQELKSKVMNDAVLSESDATKVSYKSLYMDCQKKIEALQEEKQQLSLRLENALTKLEVYDKGTRIFVEALDKLKDAMAVITNLPKSTEATTNKSSQAITECYPSTSAGQEPREPSSK